MTRGVLCLHGFSGGTFELKPLADALAAGGHIVDSPALAGHDGSDESLAAAEWTDWFRSAEVALKALVMRAGGPAVIVGGSMGGLLAIRLARLRPTDVAALVLLAPPVRLRPIEQSGLKALTSIASTLRLGPGASLPRTRPPDLTDSEQAAALPYGDAYPLAALRSLVELQAVARADLEYVTAPALIVQGRRDRTVPLDVSAEVAARLGSSRIEHLWLENSGHLVALDVDRDRLIAEVAAFVTGAGNARVRLPV